VTSSEPSALPEHMRAWVLGDPGQLSLVDKPIPMPRRAEVLVRIDAVAICAPDLEIIHHGAPAMIGGEGKSATHRAEALMSQKRFDATKIHTQTFGLHDLLTALRYAGEHIDDAIKVVMTTRNAELARGSLTRRNYR